MHQIGLLGDHPDDGRQGGGIEVAKVDAVDRDATFGRIGKSRQQGRSSRLARPGRAGQTDRTARGDRQIDVVQGGPVGIRVDVADVFVADLPAQPIRVHSYRIGGRSNLRHQIEILEDPAEQGHRGHPLGSDIEQPHDWAEDLGLQGSERHHRADRETTVDRPETRRQIDDRRQRSEDDAHRRHPPASGQLGAHVEIDQGG